MLHFPTMEGKESEITSSWFKSLDLRNIPFVVKIADLGFCKVLDEVTDFSKTYCGTPLNMAPEMLNRENYNYKADVWSVGTVLFELLTGYSPFKDARTRDELNY